MSYRTCCWDANAVQNEHERMQLLQPGEDPLVWAICSSGRSAENMCVYKVRSPFPCSASHSS